MKDIIKKALKYLVNTNTKTSKPVMDIAAIASGNPDFKNSPVGNLAQGNPVGAYKSAVEMFKRPAKPVSNEQLLGMVMASVNPMASKAKMLHEINYLNPITKQAYKRKYYNSAGQAKKAFNMIPRGDYIVPPPREVIRKSKIWE